MATSSRPARLRASLGDNSEHRCQRGPAPPACDPVVEDVALHAGGVTREPSPHPEIPYGVARRSVQFFVIGRSAVRVRSPAPIESTTYRVSQTSGIGPCQHHAPPLQPSFRSRPGTGRWQTTCRSSAPGPDRLFRLSGQREPFSSDVSGPLNGPAIRRRRGGCDRRATGRTGRRTVAADSLASRAVSSAVAEPGLTVSAGSARCGRTRNTDRIRWKDWSGTAVDQPAHSRVGRRAATAQEDRGTGSTRVASVLRMAALSLQTLADRARGCLPAHRSLQGGAVAIFAIARKLAILVYRMLRQGQDYVDLGGSTLRRPVPTAPPRQPAPHGNGLGLYTDPGHRDH